MAGRKTPLSSVAFFCAFLYYNDFPVGSLWNERNGSAVHLFPGITREDDFDSCVDVFAKFHAKPITIPIRNIVTVVHGQNFQPTPKLALSLF